MILNMIHSKKIKITLDETDMSNLGITFQTMSYYDPKIRTIIKNFISNAGISTGFQISKKSIIEVFPEKSGGISLYITNLDYENSLEEKEFFLQKNKHFNLITRLNSLHSLERFCYALYYVDKSISPNTSLYYDNAYFYLCIKTENLSHEKLFRHISSEFGKTINPGSRSYNNFFLFDDLIELTGNDAVKRITAPKDT